MERIKPRKLAAEDSGAAAGRLEEKDVVGAGGEGAEERASGAGVTAVEGGRGGRAEGDKCHACSGAWVVASIRVSSSATRWP
jgi:hypothetical protein